MSSLIPPELDALAARSDFELPVARRVSLGFWARVRRSARAFAVFVAATLLFAAIIYIPVLASSLAGVQGVTVAGETLATTEFLHRLGVLFMGTCVVALALTSFLALVRMSAVDLVDIESHQEDVQKQTFIQLSAFQLLGPGR